ncbi:MAG: hypothetical protein M3395_00320 [Chloroflexota bacterium]|nr:hypothetical protein [Chloroflexota bacterium]
MAATRDGDGVSGQDVHTAQVGVAHRTGEDAKVPDAVLVASVFGAHGTSLTRACTGRALRAGIAAAWGVLVAYALAAAWLGIGSDGSLVRVWLVVAVALFGVAFLVLMDDRHIALTVVLAVGCVVGLVGGVYGATVLAMLSDVPCLTASLNSSWPTGLPCSTFEESKTIGRYLIAIGAVSTVTLADVLGTVRIRKGGR